MARVTNADVQALLPGTTIDFTPYITAANLLTNKLAASQCGSKLSEEELIEIEKYLVVHFGSIANPQLSLVSESFEGATNTAARGNVNTKEGLLSTQWGQMANTLSGGCLELIQLRQPNVEFF